MSTSLPCAKKAMTKKRGHEHQDPLDSYTRNPETGCVVSEESWSYIGQCIHSLHDEFYTAYDKLSASTYGDDKTENHPLDAAHLPHNESCNADATPGSLHRTLHRSIVKVYRCSACNKRISMDRLRVWRSCTFPAQSMLILCQSCAAN